MTVSAVINKISFPGPGGTVFAANFPIVSASDVEVYKTDQTTGGVVGSALVNVTDYTVTGVGGTGFTVTLTADLGAYGLLIRRIEALTMVTNLPDEGTLRASSIQAAIDKLARLAQQLQEQLNRSLHHPITNAGTANEIPEQTSDGTILSKVSGKWTWLAAATAQLAADLLSTAVGKGAALVSYLAPYMGAAGRTQQDKNAETVSVLDFPGADLGARIQAAVNAGAQDILVTDSNTPWLWTTPVVLPDGWRGRIWSKSSNQLNYQIIGRTGHNYPMIDAQGATYVELDGLRATGDDTTGACPACFLVFARMPSGASSGNHKVVNCVYAGWANYCIVYNCGGEEIVFQNNFWSLYATSNVTTYQTACIVHTLTEESYFSGIVTKASRTNGVSCSAIHHSGDDIQNNNTTSGGSAIYIGPNVNNVRLDLLYGYTVASSHFLTLGGYFDNIVLNATRLETDKSSHIAYAPNDFSAGSICLVGGAYYQTGVQNSGVYAVDIAGTTASKVSVYIAPNVSWLSSYGGNVEDIYLLRSTRITQCDVSFLLGAMSEFLGGTKVNIATLLASRITMGLSANLTVGAYGAYGHKLQFIYDLPNAKPTHSFIGGSAFSGGSNTFNALPGGYAAQDVVSPSTASTVMVYFENPNGVVGQISSSGTATSYITSSDYRLKENVVPIDKKTALDAVKSWPIKSFSWKADGSADVGVLAHELQAVKPSAVSGEKDAEFEDGAIKPQGVDYSKLVPELVAAVQYMAIKMGL